MVEHYSWLRVNFFVITLISTLNQTYNNTFSGGANEMLGKYRQSQERWTGDLVRNFRTAMI